jgi:beta-lactamase regulating signal transducer with metallopeptidase domain
MPFLNAAIPNVDALLVGVLAFALRGTVILLGAWGATRLLRRASAATRHAVWTSAIAAVLVLPLLSATIPAWNVPVFTITARTDVAEPVESNAAPTSPTPVITRQPNAQQNTQSAPSAVISGAGPMAATSISADRAIAYAWLAVALLMIVRLAVANARLQSWRRSARPVDDNRWLGLLRRLSTQYGIQRPVVLLESESTDVPVTWGIVYPVVLLPATAHQWDEDQRIAVLTHELAHVKRFDALSQLLAQVVLGLQWFNPVVWLAVRRMRLEREHACDDFVLVAAGARASRYADDLLGFARRLNRPTAPAAAALAMARRSELEGRLLAILDPAMKRTAIRRARVASLTMGVILLAMPLAAFRPATRVVTIPMESTTARPLPATASSSSATSQSPAARRVEPRQEPALDSPQLETLMRRVGVVASAPSRKDVVSPTLPRQHIESLPPQQPVELATLVEVARAAKRMTSDYEKGVLLGQIAKRYVRDDSLREAYLGVVFSMSSDYERSKAVLALLERDSLPSASTARVLQSAVKMTSDHSRSTVLQRINPTTFADTAVQRAYTEVIVAMSSEHEKAVTLMPLVKFRPLTQDVQLGLLRVAGRITSSTDKANVLLAFLANQGIADDTVRRAFMKAAEGLTSDYDYRRVMSAVLR